MPWKKITDEVESDLSDHEVATQNVHGVGDSDVASQAEVDGVEDDLTDHTSATEDVHGVGTSNVASQDDIDTHENATQSVHGVGNSDVASQSDVDEKSDDPHDNTAHSEDYTPQTDFDSHVQDGDHDEISGGVVPRSDPVDNIAGNVYVQSTEPSSHSEGDIWVEK